MEPTLRVEYLNKPVACIINILQLSNDASRTVIDDSRAMHLVVASLTDDSGGIIYILEVLITLV